MTTTHPPTTTTPSALSAGRPWLRMWLLLTVALGPTLVSMTVGVAEMHGTPVPHGTSVELVARSAGIVGATTWLCTLLNRAGQRSWRFAAVELAGLIVLCQWTESRTAQTLSWSVLVSWLTCTLLSSDGVQLRDLFRARPLDVRLWRRWSPAVVAFAGLWFAAIVSVLLARLLAARLPAWVPALHSSQEQALGWTTTTFAVANIVWSVVAEELLMTAAVTILVRAAGRPLRQTYAVSVGIRVLCHGYLGLPAVAMAVLGVVSLYLYRRTGRLGPILAAHALFDLLPLLAN